MLSEPTHIRVLDLSSPSSHSFSLSHCQSISLYFYIYIHLPIFSPYIWTSLYSFLLPRELSCNLIIFVHRQVSSPKWREVPIRLQCNEISVCPATSSDDATLCYVFERRGEEEALEDSRGVTRMHESLSLSLSLFLPLPLSFSLFRIQRGPGCTCALCNMRGRGGRERGRERERKFVIG